MRASVIYVQTLRVDDVRMSKNISLERRAEIGRERRSRTRSRILEVAFELLGRESGRSTRIDEICEAAAVARGTFYNHFTSIDEMFATLAFEISHSYNDAVRAVINRLPAGAIRSAFALRYYLHKTREDPAWGWAMVHLSAGGPIFGEETFLYATASIEEGMMTEQFRIISVEVGRSLMMGATLAGMIALLRGSQTSTFPEDMVTQTLKGLGVSETLIRKCVEPELPDPYGYPAQHGGAPA